jgi:hypothetical protein
VHVREDEKSVHSSNVHVVNFDPETSIVEHLFTHFNNESRFRDVVSPEKESRS